MSIRRAARQGTTSSLYHTEIWSNILRSQRMNQSGDYAFRSKHVAYVLATESECEGLERTLLTCELCVREPTLILR